MSALCSACHVPLTFLLLYKKYYLLSRLLFLHQGTWLLRSSDSTSQSETRQARRALYEDLKVHSGSCATKRSAL